ncbi:MAG TPA: hypothetical protein VK422_21445 [Pyrinomonadaceae bacterium]|nr:hypothetical protein [Pyrinomonadaceae bacterium]
MYLERKTAILSLRSDAAGGRAPQSLDVQRRYRLSLTIDGVTQPGGVFNSPIGDVQWRDLMESLNSLTSKPRDTNRHDYARLYDAGLRLYQAVCQASPALQAFIVQGTGPRRLVIESDCPEIHQLPWEAMLDEAARPLFERGVSVVHFGTRPPDARPFDPKPFDSGEKLSVRALFGPDVERSTLAAFQSLEAAARAQIDRSLDVSVMPEEGRPEDLRADVLQIEGHGGRIEGDIRLDEWVGADNARALAERISGGAMMLLWSCYSASIQPWGESPAMLLHQSGTKFVLSFSTELHYDSGADIAQHFYDAVFNAREAVDPETAVVGLRKRLYEKHKEACEWVSMTLWLRQPVDLSEAVLSGPRLPHVRWSPDPGAGDEFGRLAELLKERVVPGRVLLITGERLPNKLPYGLATDYRGAVVHMRGRKELSDPAIFAGLGVAPTKLKSHAGDRLLQLLEAFGDYPRSLLIWSDVTRVEVQTVEALASVPKNLAIVLVSKKEIRTGPGIIAVGGGAARGKAETTFVKLTSGVTEESFEGLDESERYEQASRRWEKLSEKDYGGWDEARQLDFQVRGYWVYIRQERREEAEARIKVVEAMRHSEAGFEALMMRGNFDHRLGLYDKAREAYTKALHASGNGRDKARARLELAYLSGESGDRLLAEEFYKDAVGLLESVKEVALKDDRWRSALGRVLRDYADLLAVQSERLKEAEQLLDRAMVIHAIDDRLNQLAAALRTRGKLQRTRERWAAAEADLRAAASIFISNGNRVGWTESIWEMAELASKLGRGAQALALLEHAYGRLESEGGDSFVKQKGRTALRIARVYWEQGGLPEAHRWSGEALRLLPENLRKDCSEAAGLREFTASLVEEGDAGEAPAGLMPAPPKAMRRRS